MNNPTQIQTADFDVWQPTPRMPIFLTRDMVLNSFYQMITKRRQQVREAGNEKVHFQPQYIHSDCGF
jgi:hypothetical protein